MNHDEALDIETRVVMDSLELMAEVLATSTMRFCLIGSRHKGVMLHLREQARKNPEMEKHFRILDEFTFFGCGLNPTPNMLFFDTKEHCAAMDMAIHQAMGVNGCTWEEAVEVITEANGMNCTKIQKGDVDEPPTVH